MCYIQIKRGEIREVHAIGEHFAVFRSSNESGSIFVTDLYCPHLGASLGSGGTVKGNCITCPFHKWSFDGSSGECVDIPYSTKVISFNYFSSIHSDRYKSILQNFIIHFTNIILSFQAPTFGNIKTWKSVECNHLVYVWYHAEGVEPQWDPIRIAQIEPTNSAEKQWIYQGRNEFEVRNLT